ncbi:MAG: glycosyltransferase [Terriglobia bacterium]
MGDYAARMSDPSTPLVSAIVPARNEALDIARAVRSLAMQADIREIIVVDDDSRDETASVLADLKRTLPALRVVDIKSLPAGWLGKTHAAAEGATHAQGEWFLFTDADTEHLPGSLRMLLGRAEREGADLLSLSPGQRVPTWWEKAVIPIVYSQLSHLYKFDEVNSPASSAAAANGQFILVRRSAYERAGGHTSVRAEILDDVALARRVKAAGGRLLFLPGADWVQTRMYRTFGEMWQGWTKNLFLLYGGSAAKIARAVLVLMAQWILGPLSLVLASVVVMPNASGPWLCAGATASTAAVLWWMISYRQRLSRLGFSESLGRYFWAGAPLFTLMLLNSALAYKLRGAVEWKGRTYSVKGTL